MADDKLTLINGKLRIDKSGGRELVLSPKPGGDEPCCCSKCIGCSGSSSGSSGASSVLSASGALMGGTCVPFHVDQPFNPCCCSGSNIMDILDEGQYPNAGSVFGRAISGSFDSVAVKDGFVACFYAAPNFVGDPFVVAKGPVVINNANWRNDLRSGPAPGYRMTWSTTNMYGDSRWSNPGSLIICKYDGSTSVPDIGFS
jgi:hypothetical protein